MSATIDHSSVLRRCLSITIGLVAVSCLAHAAAPAQALLAIPEPGHAAVSFSFSPLYPDDQMIVRHRQMDSAWFARFSLVGR